MKTLPIASVAVGTWLLVLSCGVALAASNPSGTGRPNQTCQDFAGFPAEAPGGSGTAQGSVFNEPGIGSTLGGTGGQRYNAVGAPSQYDVACYQQFQRLQLP